MPLQEADLSEAQFQSISQMVHRHCGINLHDGKRELVRARVAKRLRAGGFSSVDAYLQNLERDDGSEFSHLVDVLSTNLTSFFRERAHFDYLAQHHIPALLIRLRKSGRLKLRLWSAGCSSGEEPYTLAMVMIQALEALDGPRAMQMWDLKILATDISRPVLAAARRGLYPLGRVESVPPPLRQRFFNPTRLEGQPAVEVGTALRHHIVFNYLNLNGPWPFDGPFDVTFCRNVMIYFDKPTQQGLVNRFYDCLAPGGLLFTGHSESLTGINHRFKYLQPTIYAKP